MFLVGILSWWYSAGWYQRLKLFQDRLARTNDVFSITILASTLFAPYRQISAGHVSGSLNTQLRAFFDKTLSRVIGAVVRITMIAIGIIVLLLQIIVGSFVLVIWGIIPLFPLIGAIMMIIGWTPVW
jgi:hypothetical protein